MALPGSLWGPWRGHPAKRPSRGAPHLPGRGPGAWHCLCCCGLFSHKTDFVLMRRVPRLAPKQQGEEAQVGGGSQDAWVSTAGRTYPHTDPPPPFAFGAGRRLKVQRCAFASPCVTAASVPCRRSTASVSPQCRPPSPRSSPTTRS